MLVTIGIFSFVLFAVRTYERNNDWIDEEIFYKYIICAMDLISIGHYVG